MEDNQRYALDDQLNTLIKHLLDSFIQLSEVLRNGTGGNALKSQNQFGDIQLDTDMQCDEIIFQHLKDSGVVAFALSEEKPQLIEINGDSKPYIVTFDPLDGSSIIDTNFTVGSIFGVWKNDSRKLIGHKVSDQITSGAVLYGSRTSVIFFNTQNNRVEEWTLNKGKWILSKFDLQISTSCKLFAPGNLRAGTDYPQYKKCIDYWIDNGYTLRYTGGMVPDIYQIFIRKQGIFTNLGSQKHKAKLRLLYEVAPLAFLVEQAGGKSTTGSSNMMDTLVESYDQRLGVAVGSQDEIQRIQQFLQQ